MAEVGRLRLGSQGLEVSAQGLGCMGMSYFYGPPKPESEMIALIHHAVSRGVTFLDTSDAYGPFTNEILLGKAIKGIRDKVEIATKFGMILKDGGSEFRGDAAYVRAACEASLKRLDVDCIDLYYQHRVDSRVPIEETQLVSLKNREYEGLKRLGRISQLALEDRLVLVRSGLHRVVQSRYMVMDPSLLLEMLATWDTRAHAFHLPGGDLMITPRLVRRITCLPAHGAPAILDSGTHGRQDKQEAQEFFTGAVGRVTRRGIALSDILQGPVSELRKVIVLIIMHRVSHSTNYYDIPYGWRRVVRQVEAGERLNWAALLARGMITRLDALAGKAHGNYPYCSILMCMLFDFFPRTAPRGPKRVLTIFEPLMNRWEMRWRRPGSHVERDVGGAAVRELRVQDLVVDPYAGVVWPSDEENEEEPGPEVAGNSREEQANTDGPQGSAGREPIPPPQEESVELVDSDQEENDTEIACRLEGYFPGIERHRLLAGEPPVVEAGHAWERAAMARDVIRALEIENARLQGQNSVLQSQMSFIFERGLTGQIAEPIARRVRGAGGFQGMQQRSGQASRGEPFQGMPPPS